MNHDLDTASKYVYGLGSFAERVVNSLSEINVKIDGIIDHIDNMPIKAWSLPCFKLSEIELRDEDIIFLGVCNLYGDLKKISENIREINPKVKIFGPVQLAIELDERGYAFTNYWLSGDTSIYDSATEEIGDFESLLSDVRSKELLHSIIEYRTHGLIDTLPQPDPLSEQYLPLNLPTPPNQLQILELGSFRGEDIVRFQNRGFEFLFGLALEPDLGNYLQLVENLKLNEISKIVPLPLGAWSSTTTLRFNASGASGARVEAHGDEVVSVISPDDLAYGLSINYIKMDIEGAEEHAIVGAQKIIARYLPHLAISVYHEPNHLWKLGLTVERMVPKKYDFYLRTYGHQTFDTVLYCIPR
jgi:FkbM family methyltransferase